MSTSNPRGVELQPVAASSAELQRSHGISGAAQSSSDADVEVKYLNELDGVLREAFAGLSVLPLKDVLKTTGGAFPTLVVERLRALGLHWTVHTLDTMEEPSPSPELHPLDFEWHFTPETIDRFVDLIGTRDSTLIGLPTIAASVRSTDFLLIERNPFAVIRKPTIIRRGEAVIKDVKDVVPEDFRPRGLVAFDAPWYLGESLLWLSRAASLVVPGGLIVFALFPPLLRPNARAERNTLLNYAESLGAVEIQENALVYTTPRFEAEALDAAGVPAIASWRHGDLVFIRTSASPAHQLAMLAEPLSREPWSTFQVGRQVIKLRQFDAGRTARDWFSHVPGLSGWRYPSVSLRDASRTGVDLWTSRNRVAAVGDRPRMNQFLRRLSDAASADRVLSQYGRSGGEKNAIALRDLLDI